MPSTEFLLYLVIVILAVFLVMNYYKDTNAPSDTQYRYIPIYAEGTNNKRSNEYYDNSSESSNKNRRKTGLSEADGQNVNVDIYNGTENVYGGPGAEAGYGPYGPGFPGGPGLGPVFPPGAPVPRSPPGPLIDPLRKFDYDAVNDEFTPPFRRSYYDEYNYRLPPGLLPLYTRGPPGRFRKIGTLVAQGVAANDKFKFLILMGRQKYPCREYEYYATSSNVEHRLKFYIHTKGKEIYDDDIVTIRELEGYTFKFKEDPDLSPRYDPYFV
jgi:hypothetical protein